MTDRIGRYLVIQRLGEGGIGEVFLAQRDGDSRLCALKRLLPERIHHGSARARLHREAHVATFLDHPTIASVYGAGDEGGSFCIAAEFVPGHDVFTIAARLRAEGRVFEPRFGLAIALAVLEALAYAHDALSPEGVRIQLVHRDLSPRNIMVSYAGQVKVIDFGVARANVDEFRTEAGLLVGSPNYVSPEQVDGAPVDRRSDLYSLSVVLFEMLTGKRLASGANVFAVLRSVLTEAAPPASSVNPALPRELDPILARGLAKAPEERWPDATSYLAALQPIAAWIGVAGRAELGVLVRELFPAEEESAARVIAEARARVEEPGELMEETRAAFWEGTIIRTRTEALPRPRRRRMRWVLEIAIAVSVLMVALLLIPDRRPEPVPSGPPRPIAPTVTPRVIDEPVAATPVRAAKKTASLPPPPQAPPPRPPAQSPPPAKPIVVRSNLEQTLDGLKARAARSNDPEMQAFAGELERLASGNTHAEGALKRVTLCMVDRTCGNDRLYRLLDAAVHALDQSSAALKP